MPGNLDRSRERCDVRSVRSPQGWHCAGRLTFHAGTGEEVSMSTQSESRAVLSIENLTLTLPPGADRPFSLKDISLELRTGEILCVVGESGSGKSMCASALLGLLPSVVKPTAGRVLFEGRGRLALSNEDWRELRGRRI